ncbi:MAG TPA: gas vesicle protein K [Vicinamibacterales bacterium]|nr:gas vesicle protein K [Vicinamibacterales bacterium]
MTRGARRVTRAGGAGRAKRPAAGKGAEPAAAREIEAIRKQIQGVAAAPPRWNANPDDVRKSVLKLVLTLVELIRQLLERQAIRRMEAGTLTGDETEAVGLALMRLQDTILDLAKQFDIPPDELNLDLGPIGKLM